MTNLEPTDGVRVPLSGGLATDRFALVDAEDAERVLGHRWHVSRQGYAVTSLRRCEKGEAA